MEYSEETKKLATKYHLLERDIMFCRLIAAGADRADSYAAIYDHGRSTTAERARTNANEFIKNNPGATLVISLLKRSKPTQRQEQEATETEEEKEKRKERRKEFATRSGILDRLSDITENLTGKEELQALQLLAKMQGLDKPDEQEEEEKRVYFLPWVSGCRSCALMEVYRRNQAKNEAST